MIGISAAGPSIVVPALAGMTAWPPWQASLGLPGWILFVMWGVAVIAAAGVVSGLIAVARGARPRIRPLLAASFIAVATFAVLPPAGSTDAQSYAIDGSIVVLGHSPYVTTPAQMVRLGDRLAVGSPSTWQKSLSDYGPLATAEEWLSAEFGGWSMAAVTFWLKLWVEIAFVAVTLLLDRALRSDPAMRVRAHLLWSLNPLVLWEIVASGHVDGLAVAFGLAGLLCISSGGAIRPYLFGGKIPRTTSPGGPIPPIPLLRTGGRPPVPPTEGEAPPIPVVTGQAPPISSAGTWPWAIPSIRPSLWRCAGAGALIGLAADVKSPFLVFGLGAAWAVRRSPAALASLAAGAAVVLVPSYAAFGTPSLAVLFQRGQEVTWDNLYQVIYRPILRVPFGVDSAPADLSTIALVLFLALSLLAFFRMPNRMPRFPAVTPALALSMGWIFLWPFQRPWYDVMLIALLALYPASWLDWVILGRLCFGAITYFEATSASPASTLQHVQLFTGEWVTSSVRFLAVAVLVWMCVSRRWGFRSGDGELLLPGEPLSTALRS
ncbi:MAG TPA: hypothetical protein VGG75_06325 [Trebonia sp.]